MADGINITAIVLTAAFTVFGATVVFVVGQLTMIVFVEQIRAQARARHEAAQALLVYTPLFSFRQTPVTSYEMQFQTYATARAELRRLASILLGSINALPWYSVFERLGLVRPPNHLYAAVRNLLWLSNCIPAQDDETVVKAVAHRATIFLALGLDEGAPTDNSPGM